MRDKFHYNSLNLPSESTFTRMEKLHYIRIEKCKTKWNLCGHFNKIGRQNVGYVRLYFCVEVKIYSFRLLSLLFSRTYFPRLPQILVVPRIAKWQYYTYFSNDLMSNFKLSILSCLQKIKIKSLIWWSFPNFQYSHV